MSAKRTSVDICRELQLRISRLSKDNLAENAAHVDDVVKSEKKGLLSFNKVLFEIVPARPLDFQLFAEFVTKVSALADAENRKSFIAFLLTRLREPNQSEVCEFATHLVESKFLEVGEYLSLLEAALDPSFENINYIQILYGIVRIGRLLETESTKLASVLAKLETRKANIEKEENLDYNADFFVMLYDALKDIRKGGWDIPEDYPNRQLLKCLMSDDSAKLEELCKGELDVNSTLDGSLLTPSSMITFGPPLACVAAFYGSLKCLKVLVSHGADLSVPDDEERLVSDFAAASGNVELLEYLKEQEQSFVLAPSAAVEYWRYDAFDWLHENVFPTLTGIEPEGKPTMLHAAAKVNNIKIAEVLKEAEASTCVTDDYGVSFVLIGLLFMLLQQTTLEKF